MDRNLRSEREQPLHDVAQNPHSRLKLAVVGLQTQCATIKTTCCMADDLSNALVNILYAFKSFERRFYIVKCLSVINLDACVNIYTFIYFIYVFIYLHSSVIYVYLCDSYMLYIYIYYLFPAVAWLVDMEVCIYRRMIGFRLDMTDGGSAHFAETVREIKKR